MVIRTFWDLLWLREGGEAAMFTHQRHKHECHTVRSFFATWLGQQQDLQIFMKEQHLLDLASASVISFSSFSAFEFPYIYFFFLFFISMPLFRQTECTKFMCECVRMWNMLLRVICDFCLPSCVSPCQTKQTIRKKLNFLYFLFVWFGWDEMSSGLSVDFFVTYAAECGLQAGAWLFTTCSSVSSFFTWVWIEILSCAWRTCFFFHRPNCRNQILNIGRCSTSSSASHINIAISRHKGILCDLDAFFDKHSVFENCCKWQNLIDFKRSSFWVTDPQNIVNRLISRTWSTMILLFIINHSVPRALDWSQVWNSRCRMRL